MLQTFSNLDLINLTPPAESVVNSFTKEDLQGYLSNITTQKNQKSLRTISRYLYYASSHYRSLINYYSTLYNFDFSVDPESDAPPSTINKDKFEKDFYKAVSNYEKLNIKNESLKIRAFVYTDGVFYGFIREGKNGTFIQQLEPDYCQISFIDSNRSGLYGFSFNFSIFKTNEALLSNYPEEFTAIYLTLKNTKNLKNWWAKIDSSKSICIKATTGLHPIPPFVALFESILDIADFKALYKGREEMGNYQLLYQYIPIRLDKDADPDQFMISGDFVKEYHESIADSLTKNIGLITSPMKIEAIKFERDTADTNRVAEATSQYWNEAGVPELLFGNATSSTGLKLSIVADEASLVGVVKEIEKWVNEYAKINFPKNNKYSFVFRILETTKFNKQEYVDSLMKVASGSIPVKREIMSALGMKPSSMVMNSFLENEVLKLHEKLIPLQTSYTQPADSEQAGRTPNATGTLSESGDKNVENDANDSED